MNFSFRNAAIPFMIWPKFYDNKKVVFMLDSGAMISIIKISKVPQNVEIKPFSVTIMGMGGAKTHTLGLIKLNLYDRKVRLHIVPDDSGFFGDGILGADFMYKEKVTFSSGPNFLKMGNYEIPFYLNVDEILRYLEFDEKKNCEIAEVGKIDIKENLDDFDNMEINYMTWKNIKWERKLEKAEKQALLEPFFEYDYSLSSTMIENDDNLENEIIIDRAVEVIRVAKIDYLEESQRDKIEEILKKNNDVIYLKGDSWVGSKIGEHPIDTADAVPVKTRVYGCPYKLRNEMNKQVKEWLKLGSIQPSNSEYNSPAWIVPKKDDRDGNKRWRVIIDYRKLNKITKPDGYPLPDLTAIFDRIGQAKYFSVLD